MVPIDFRKDKNRALLSISVAQKGPDCTFVLVLCPMPLTYAFLIILGTLGVIPAEAGIQVYLLFWTPAFAGVTVWAWNSP